MKTPYGTMYSNVPGEIIHYARYGLSFAINLPIKMTCAILSFLILLPAFCTRGAIKIWARVYRRWTADVRAPRDFSGTRVDDRVATCCCPLPGSRPQKQFCNWQVWQCDTTMRCHTIHSTRTHPSRRAFRWLASWLSGLLESAGPLLDSTWFNIVLHLVTAYRRSETVR